MFDLINKIKGYFDPSIKKRDEKRVLKFGSEENYVDVMLSKMSEIEKKISNNIATSDDLKNYKYLQNKLNIYLPKVRIKAFREGKVNNINTINAIETDLNAINFRTSLPP